MSEVINENAVMLDDGHTELENMLPPVAQAMNKVDVQEMPVEERNSRPMKSSKTPKKPKKSKRSAMKKAPPPESEYSAMEDDFDTFDDDTFGQIANKGKVSASKIVKASKQRGKGPNQQQQPIDAFDYMDGGDVQEVYRDYDEYDDGMGDEGGGMYEDPQGGMYMDDSEHWDDGRGGASGPYESAMQMKQEKADLLQKISQINNRGGVTGPSQNLSLQSDLEVLRFEHKRMQDEMASNNSVKFQRRALLSVVSMIEWANEEYQPFDNVQLSGWSETVLANVDEYTPVFMELHEKYKDKVKVQPEVQLMLMLGGSALMYSLTQQMVKQNIPSMGQVMKENPELMEKLVRSMQEKAGSKDTGDTRNQQASKENGGQYEMKKPPLMSMPILQGRDVGGTPGNFPPGMGSVDYDPMPELVNKFPTAESVADDDVLSQSSAGTSKIIRINTKK